MIIITQFKSRFQAARASRASAKLLVSVGLFVRFHAALQEMVENPVEIVVSTPKRGIEIIQPPPHAHDSDSDLNWPRWVSAVESKILLLFRFFMFLFFSVDSAVVLASPALTHTHTIFFLMKRASSVSYALLFLLRVSLSSRSQSNKRQQQKAYCRKRFLVV